MNPAQASKTFCTRRPRCQPQLHTSFIYAGSCTSTPGTPAPAMTCENAAPNQQGQPFKCKKGNSRQITQVSSGNNGSCWAQTLLSEARQPWCPPTGLSTCKLHTCFSMCRILQQLNTVSWHTRTNDMRKRCSQGQSLKGKQGNSTHESVNSATRVLSAALGCGGTAASAWASSGAVSAPATFKVDFFKK